MKAILGGVLVAVLVFAILLGAFASATGPVELVLWLILAIASGVLVARSIRGGGRADSGI